MKLHSILDEIAPPSSQTDSTRVRVVLFRPGFAPSHSGDSRAARDGEKSWRPGATASRLRSQTTLATSFSSI